MRKTNISIVVLVSLDNEEEIRNDVISYLTAKKGEGKIEKATVTTHEIDVPLELTI